MQWRCYASRHPTVTPELLPERRSLRCATYYEYDADILMFLTRPTFVDYKFFTLLNIQCLAWCIIPSVCICWLCTSCGCKTALTDVCLAHAVTLLPDTTVIHEFSRRRWQNCASYCAVTSCKQNLNDKIIVAKGKNVENNFVFSSSLRPKCGKFFHTLPLATARSITFAAAELLGKKPCELWLNVSYRSTK